MRFHVDADTGAAIGCWVTLDNPIAIPSVIVHASNLEPIEVEATLLRQDILDAGLHSTGMVGFIIDESRMPGITQAESVEIFESETKFCIYRRFSKSKNIEKKLFIFDCSIMPQKNIINNINNYFAIRHNFVERHGYETIITMIHNYFSKSIFLTGRPQVTRYVSGLRTMDFTIAALLRNPFEELAERLLFLNLVSKSSAPALLSSFMTGLEPAIEFASNLQFDDPRSLNLAFRKLTQQQRLALANPTTRMLACSLDERVERRHVTASLDHLSQMDLVGVRSKFAAFSQMLGDLMGADVVSNAEIETFHALGPLTDTLSRVGSVVDLLEHDLALYSFAEEAVDVGLGEKQSL